MGTPNDETTVANSIASEILIPDDSIDQRGIAAHITASDYGQQRVLVVAIAVVLVVLVVVVVVIES